MRNALCLILLCLILSGCAADMPPETDPPLRGTLFPDDGFAQNVQGHSLESCAPGALQIYSLTGSCSSMMAAGENLIVLCGNETTTIRLLSRDDLSTLAALSLPFHLEKLQKLDDGFSYYDPIDRQIVVLSSALTDLGRIAAPQGMIGTPLLCPDGATLYYCTSSSVRAWDLSSGIRRCVKEMSYPMQEIVAFHEKGNILQCRITKNGSVRTLFLDGDMGKLLHDLPGDVSLVCTESGWYASLPEGSAQLQLLGQKDETPMLLTPSDIYASCWYLESLHCVISASGSDVRGYTADLGIHFADLPLPAGWVVQNISECDEDNVYLQLGDSLGNSVLCRWDLYSDVCFVNDTQRYLGPLYTRSEPDITSLEQCRSDAESLGQKYGIRIQVWDDVLQFEPWDYRLETEYLAPVLRRALMDLDLWLAHYPQEILNGIREHFPDLTICLVRGIHGTPESGSLDSANGIQFLRDSGAVIVISVGKYAERALYHEFYHIMETRLLTDSTALDHWDSLNPYGFYYDLDLEKNKQRQGGSYLQPETRAFIDTYSMSFPKEDRARIMECAMTDGKGSLFRSPTMQKKLSCLSQAIREAYGLENASQRFLWEQYLK